jgi:hypothetical protein
LPSRKGYQKATVSAIAIIIIIAILGFLSGKFVSNQTQIATMITSSGPGYNYTYVQYGTYTRIIVNGSITNYDVSVEMINKTVKVNPGKVYLILFNVTSPVQGSFYFLIGSAGQSGGLTENSILTGNPPIPLPDNLVLTYPKGKAFEYNFEYPKKISIIFPVEIIVLNNSETRIFLSLYGIQHQSPVPGMLLKEFQYDFEVDVG